MVAFCVALILLRWPSYSFLGSATSLRDPAWQKTPNLPCNPNGFVSDPYTCKVVRCPCNPTLNTGHWVYYLKHKLAAVAASPGPI